MSADSDDDRLLGAMASGDRSALQCLMSRHAAAMLSLAERTTGSADEADEIVQEAFVKTWVMAPIWRAGGEAAFATWLYRVVLNACLDFRRRRPVLPLDSVAEPVDPGPGGFEAACASQRRALVASALAELPERQRAALSLHYFSELSAPSAARVLDVSVSAFEALLVRGKRALRQGFERRGIVRGDLP